MVYKFKIYLDNKQMIDFRRQKHHIHRIIPKHLPAYINFRSLNLFSGIETKEGGEKTK